MLPDALLDFVAANEGLSLKAYPDPATGGAPWTIGYGCTRPNGRPVEPGQTCTKAQAREWLAEALQSAWAAVADHVRVSLTDGQRFALVDFAFNVGVGAFEGSTLLQLVNAGRMNEASLEFGKWTKAGGRVVEGLVNRRAAERRMFVS